MFLLCTLRAPASTAIMASPHVCFKVNTFFDTNEDAVLRYGYGVASILSCMSFRVGGTIVVTFRVVSAIVTLVVSLSAWLNQ